MILRSLINNTTTFYRATLLVSLFSLLFSQLVHAQRGYSPGFVIKLSGDTLHGFIKQKKSRKASESCTFKDTPESAPHVFKPSEISAYRYTNDKFYVAKSYQTKKGSETVFMEYLIKGKANIYYLRNSEGDRYFLEKEGESMIELTEPELYMRTPHMVSSRYKGKLIVAMEDANIQPRIEETQLNYSSLIDLAKEYHEKVCTTESCIVYAKPKEKVSVHYSLLGGYTLNRYNFGKQLASNFGPGFQVGLSIDFKNILFSDQRTGLNIGLLIENDRSFTLSTYKKAEGHYTADWSRVTYEGVDYSIGENATDLNFTYVNDLNVDVDVTALKIPITLNYAFPADRFSVQVGAGLTNRFILGRNDEFRNWSFDKQYGKSINSYFFGPTVTAAGIFKLQNSKAVTLNILATHLTDPSATNQYLRLNITQLAFRVGYVF